MGLFTQNFKLQGEPVYNDLFLGEPVSYISNFGSSVKVILCIAILTFLALSHISSFL